MTHCILALYFVHVQEDRYHQVHITNLKLIFHGFEDYGIHVNLNVEIYIWLSDLMMSLWQLKFPNCNKMDIVNLGWIE